MKEGKIGKKSRFLLDVIYERLTNFNGNFQMPDDNSLVLKYFIDVKVIFEKTPRIRQTV